MGLTLSSTQWNQEQMYITNETKYQSFSATKSTPPHEVLSNQVKQCRKSINDFRQASIVPKSALDIRHSSSSNSVYMNPKSQLNCTCTPSSSFNKSNSLQQHNDRHMPDYSPQTDLLPPLLSQPSLNKELISPSNQSNYGKPHMPVVMSKVKFDYEALKPNDNLPQNTAKIQGVPMFLEPPEEMCYTLASLHDIRRIESMRVRTPDP